MLYKTLTPWIDDVWNRKPSSIADVYGWYAYDQSLADYVENAPMEKTKRLNEFVDGLLLTMRETGSPVQRIDKQDKIPDGTTYVYSFDAQGIPLRPPRSLDNWQNFYSIARSRAGTGHGGPAMAITDRVYVTFEVPKRGNPLDHYTKHALDTVSHLIRSAHFWHHVVQFKVAAPGAADRRDHLVLYLRSAKGIKPVRAALNGATKGGVRFSHRVVPGTKFLQPGVGAARQPSQTLGKEVSFGQSLAQRIFVAYQKSTSQVDSDRESFALNVADEFCAHGIDPQKPYLRPSSEPLSPCGSKRTTPRPADASRATKVPRATNTDRAKRSPRRHAR